MVRALPLEHDGASEARAPPTSARKIHGGLRSRVAHPDRNRIGDLYHTALGADNRDTPIDADPADCSVFQ